MSHPPASTVLPGDSTQPQWRSGSRTARRPGKRWVSRSTSLNFVGQPCRLGTVKFRRISPPAAAPYFVGKNRRPAAPARSDSMTARTCRAGRAGIPAPMRSHWLAGRCRLVAGSMTPDNMFLKTSAAKARTTLPRRRPAAGRYRRRSASSRPCSRRAHRPWSGRDTSGPRLLDRCSRCPRRRSSSWLRSPSGPRQGLFGEVRKRPQSAFAGTRRGVLAGPEN
jgi:hypothetical protein